MDSLAIIATETGNGQPRASAIDACAILKLLLFQLRTYLVIDGVDECEDTANFLATLGEVSETSDTRVLLLSRPILVIPISFSMGLDSTWMLPLTSEHNRGEILQFSRSELDKMKLEGLFGGETIAASTVEDIVRRANGMWLWVRLLVNLLRSPAMSPCDRCTILLDANLLEGLEGLHSGILSVIQRKYRGERTVAGEMFKWKLGSLYPLSATTLRVALAVDPGKPTTESRYLVNYPDCIPHITRSLVEAADGVLSFIHLSFQEYLQSEASQAHPEFTLRDQRAIHAESATVCLSYLTNEVRKRPLQTLDLSREDRMGGTDNDTEYSVQQVYAMPNSNRDRSSRDYPLLRYATI